LILCQPNRLARETIPEPVQLIDLMPTLLSWAGIDFDPLPLQGRDILDRQARRKPRRIFLSRFVYPEDMDTSRFNEVEYYSVIEGSWKLIVSERPEGPGTDFELYDLSGDPEEERNLGESEPARIEQPYRDLLTFLAAQQRRREIFRSVHTSTRGAAEEGASAEETREELRALGYVK
jgi:arylsulfatase A-like enzyme